MYSSWRMKIEDSDLSIGHDYHVIWKRRILIFQDLNYVVLNMITVCYLSQSRNHILGYFENMHWTCSHCYIVPCDLIYARSLYVHNLRSLVHSLQTHKQDTLICLHMCHVNQEGHFVPRFFLTCFSITDRSINLIYWV